MSICPASAIAGNILESVAVGDRESIRLPDFHRRLCDVGGQNIFRSQLVTVFGRFESSTAAGSDSTQNKQSAGQKISSMHP